MPDACAVLAFVLLASAASGQEAGTALQRAVEMPAHKALMQVIDAAGGRPVPFSTDGCSGGLSAGWERAATVFAEFLRRYEAHPPWEDCCVAHDAVYHRAGGAVSAEASYDARFAADVALKRCVIETGEARMDSTVAETGVSEETVRQAYAAIAGAMFNAVRLGGGPCSGLPWRWGYGYSGCLFQ